jgi:ribonuclease HI
VSGPAEPEVLHIHIDGGSRGNPGEAGFGIHVEDGAGGVLAELYGYLGRASNNVAEYQALLHALRWALDRGARRVQVFSDSELVVRQISGEYRVKHPDMIPLHREATSLLRRFEEASVLHVPRERNRQADRLANRALDEKASFLEQGGATAHPLEPPPSRRS